MYSILLNLQKDRHNLIYKIKSHIGDDVYNRVKRNDIKITLIKDWLSRHLGHYTTADAISHAEQILGINIDHHTVLQTMTNHMESFIFKNKHMLGNMHDTFMVDLKHIESEIFEASAHINRTRRDH